MLNMLGRGYIRTSIWLKHKADELKESELGVSGIVVAIVLVLIAILLAAIFWGNIKELVNGLFKKINTESNAIK